MLIWGNILTAISLFIKCLSLGTELFRFWDVEWISISYEVSAIDGQTEIAVVNCSFYPTADVFGNFCALLANEDLAFFGVICFNAIKVNYKS